MKYSKDIKSKVLRIKPLKPERYLNFDIDRLVVFGMYYLENDNIPLYFEYIAIALFKLFPEKFSLEHFTEFPDVNRVNNSARRLAGSIKSRGVTWATGNIENGFSLSDTGREIAEQVNEILKNPVKQDIKSTKKRSRGRLPADDISEIRSSPVFTKWVEDKEQITNYDIFSLLGAVPYAPKELLKKHLDTLKNSALTLKDKETQTFLKWVEAHFNTIFN
jgi:hypothetical protein